MPARRWKRSAAERTSRQQEGRWDLPQSSAVSAGRCRTGFQRLEAVRFVRTGSGRFPSGFPPRLRRRGFGQRLVDAGLIGDLFRQAMNGAAGSLGSPATGQSPPAGKPDLVGADDRQLSQQTGEDLVPRSRRPLNGSLEPMAFTVQCLARRTSNRLPASTPRSRPQATGRDTA